MKYASRERVLAAVQEDGRALEHAGEVMKNDVTIVRAAVQQDWRGGEYRAASKVEVWSPPWTSTAGRFQKENGLQAPAGNAWLRLNRSPFLISFVLQIVFQASSPHAMKGASPRAQVGEPDEGLWLLKQNVKKPSG